MFQFNLQPDEASASPDPKTSPRLSRASLFLTQILQVTEEADTPAAAVDLTGMRLAVTSQAVVQESASSCLGKTDRAACFLVFDSVLEKSMFFSNHV